ncbi:hypothetical protein B0H13DRAFT_2472202 [Mycena leptocephala]|nr:hypothetical protein B0H13DRAFT_2472202 [Mycena leptocephala]
MFLPLILVHLLSRNGSAAPVLHTLNDRSASDSKSCDDINNCRKLFDIIWGCLATIFACTWVSVHPNVPAPNQSQLVLFWRRLKMMLIAVIAPELMVGFAARQFIAARSLSKGGSADFASQPSDVYFTHRVRFLKNTWVLLLHGRIRVIDRVSYCHQETTRGFRTRARIPSGHKNVDAEDIMDKSKGDALSKGLAMVQGLWFTTQCVARAHQPFAVTELEVATLAFAVVNIFIWLLWWEKPLDVQRQIVVGPAKLPDPLPIRPLHAPWRDRFLIAINGIFPDYEYDPLSSTLVSFFWSLPWAELDDIQGRLATFAITPTCYFSVKNATFSFG